MIHLVRAETRKLRSTNVAPALLLTGLGLTALSIVALLAGSGPAHLGVVDVRDLLIPAAGGLAAIPLFLLGLLAVSTEYRHQTITPTLLSTPSRARLLTVKALTYALIGVGYTLTVLALELLVALPWLHARHTHVDLTDAPQAAAACLAALALLTLLGVGLGTLLRNQTLAVTVGLLFLTVLAPALLAIPKLKQAFPYLPPGSVNSLLTASDADRTLNGVQLLPPWAGVLTLTAWALGALTLGSLSTRRDST